MRHNPFNGEGGGLTSIDGNQIVNFYDHIKRAAVAGPLPKKTWKVETFLAQDTGKKNTAGKDIVNIYGGIKMGIHPRTHWITTPPDLTVRIIHTSGLLRLEKPRSKPGRRRHFLTATSSNWGWPPR